MYRSDAAKGQMRVTTLIYDFDGHAIDRKLEPMLAALTDWTPTMRPFQQAIAEPQRPLLACLAAGALLATEWCNYPPSGRASVSELSGRPLTLSLHANASRTLPGHATTTWRTPFAFSRRELLQICWQSGGSLQVRKSRLAGKTLRLRRCK